MSDGRVEQSWYGELYAIHKLKVCAARAMLGDPEGTPDGASVEAFNEALGECRDLGLTDEILLERLKI